MIKKNATTDAAAILRRQHSRVRRIKRAIRLFFFGREPLITTTTLYASRDEDKQPSSRHVYSDTVRLYVKPPEPEVVDGNTRWGPSLKSGAYCIETWPVSKCYDVFNTLPLPGECVELTVTTKLITF